MPSTTRPAQIKITHLVTGDGDQHAVYQPREPGRSYGMQFYTTFRDPVAELGIKLKSAVSLRLILVLPQHLSYQHWRRLDQVTIGAKIEANHSSISRALRELEDHGFIERRGKGPVIEWRLVETFGWTGTVEAFHEHRADRRKHEAEQRGAPSIVAEGIL